METKVLLAMKGSDIQIANSDNLRGLSEEGYKFIYQEDLENKKNDIKKKYQEEIFAKFSLTDQLNMSNNALEITAQALIEKRDLTDEELQVFIETKTAKAWIDSKRLECQEEIEKISL